MVRSRELPLFTAVAASGRYVWLAHQILPMVVRFDPVTRHAFDIAVGEKVLDLATGHDALWVATTRSLACIDEESGALRGVVPMEWTGPNTDRGKVGDAALAIDADSVWVAGIFQDAVRRVDPATCTVRDRLAVNRSEIAIAAAHGTLSLRDGDLIRRLDPDTGRVVSTLDLGGKPMRLRASEDGIWVQVWSGGVSNAVLVDSRTDKPRASIPCEGTVVAFDVRERTLWLALSDASDPGNRSTLRRVAVAEDGGVVDVALETVVWSVAAEGGGTWATTFRNADSASGLVRVDAETSTVETVVDLSVVDLTPYLPPPPQWPAARPEDVVVFVCSSCGVDISRPVGQLPAPPPIPENEVGEYERLDDWVPEGRWFREAGDTAPSTELRGSPVLNEVDLIDAARDPDSWHGCCGADGFDGPNLRCKNGHLIALQRSDCWTLNAVWLLPSLTVDRRAHPVA